MQPRDLCFQSMTPPAKVNSGNPYAGPHTGWQPSSGARQDLRFVGSLAPELDLPAKLWHFYCFYQEPEILALGQDSITSTRTPFSDQAASRCDAVRR